MSKRIVTGAALFVMMILIGGFTTVDDSFAYRYCVYTNSNNAGDLLSGYQAKEYLVSTYDKITATLDANLYEQAIKDNISNFSATGDAKYYSGVIVVTLGKGKGTKITGSLKRNSCDESAVNRKSYILDWLFGW